MSKKLRAIIYFALLSTFFVSTISCINEDEPIEESRGTITGTVTDSEGQPISDVSVALSGIGEEDVSVTTGSDGKYIFENVTLKTRAVKFSKAGWLAVSVTVNPEKFNSENIAIADMSLVFASAKITGVIKDGKNGDAAREGVTVSVGVAGTVTTEADGIFNLENLIVDNYTVTFTKANFETITKTVNEGDFVDGVATLEIIMGSSEILRGLTFADLLTAEKWYYNEYRGGRNADAYPRWDWACNYMSTLDFRGAWQEQNEGTTLQIRNNGDDQNNPADMDMFDSFVYGSKLITEDNKILSLRAQTHNADASAPAYFGVQVI